MSENYTLTSTLLDHLARLETLKQDIQSLKLDHAIQKRLKQTTLKNGIHYSTKIDGNECSRDDINSIIATTNMEEGNNIEEDEIIGYYRALFFMMTLAQHNATLTETQIRTLHALIISGGKHRTKPTPYRIGQNILRKSLTGDIIFTPPEACKVPTLMSDFIHWLNTAETQDLHPPILAAIAHYKLVKIRPFHSGNGRLARLVTQYLLTKHHYDLNGLYSLDEYYIQNPTAYSEALKGDLNDWITYLLKGLIKSFEKIVDFAQLTGCTTPTPSLRDLTGRQKKILPHFKTSRTLTTNTLAKHLKLTPRMARNIANKWVKENFLEVDNPAPKTRTYRLSIGWDGLVRTDSP